MNGKKTLKSDEFHLLRLPGRSARAPSKRRSFFLPPRGKSRRGLNLIDISLALMVASSMMFSTLRLVSHAQDMRRSSPRIAKALNLAQGWMTLYAANPGLKETPQDQPTRLNYGPEDGVYNGYNVAISVRKDKKDIAQIAAEGKLSGVSIADQVPEDVKNKSSDKTRGEPKQKSGLDIELLRIKINVTFPQGSGKRGSYEVETFRGAK